MLLLSLLWPKSLPNLVLSVNLRDFSSGIRLKVGSFVLLYIYLILSSQFVCFAFFSSYLINRATSKLNDNLLLLRQCFCLEESKAKVSRFVSLNQNKWYKIALYLILFFSLFFALSFSLNLSLSLGLSLSFSLVCAYLSNNKSNNKWQIFFKLLLSYSCRYFNILKHKACSVGINSSLRIGSANQQTTG